MNKAFLFIITLLFTTCAFAQNNVKYIDLGLPSKTLWADRNLGSTEPSDYGTHHKWDQISDALRLPTFEQLRELKSKCDWTWTSRNGHNGYKVTGPNGNSIFLPAAGYRAASINYEGTKGYYWSSNLDKSTGSVSTIMFDSNYVNHSGSYPDSRLCVRTVWPANTPVPSPTPKPVVGSIPVLTFDSSIETAQSSYKLRVRVNSSSAITDKKVYVNGQLSRGVNVVHNDGAQYVIEETLTLTEGNNNIRVEVTNATGTKSENYSVKYVKRTLQKPVLTWNSSLTTGSKDYQLQIGVTSNSTIIDTKVYVNGELSRGVNAVKNDGYNFTLNKSLQLSEGTNAIRAEVTNSDGTTIIEKTVTYKKAKADPVQPVVVGPNQPVVKKQKRQALVIGNSNYKNVNFAKLKNPANDAKAIAAKLRTLGFDVIEKEDLTLLEYGRAIDEFTRKSAGYDVSLFYYSGHAVEMDGINYLAPIDAVGEQAFDLKRECINANELLGGLEKAESPANIIVLDACRNNPNLKTRGYGMSGGLAQMLAPTGTFIMYSTAPGKTANDGLGQYSPFTEAFLSCLDKEELVLEMFAKEVSSIVKTKTNKMQAPWNSGSIDGYFYFHQK